jgi:hypothetical protein
MNQDLDRSSNAITANPSTETSVLSAEIAALRKRLAALEQGAPGHHANHRSRKAKSRAIVFGLMVATLAAGWMVLERSSVVHSQRGVDPLTIDKNGNVGIRTTTPSTTLDVNGDLKASTASINGVLNAGSVNAESVRFPDGTTQTTAAPPAGAVIAFNLPACPAGWSEYTPAYGRFIRGIDKSGGNIDPNGQRSSGNVQEDAIRNITGSISGVWGAANRAYDWGFRPGTSGAFNVPYSIAPYNRYAGDYQPPGGAGSTANFDASKVVPTAAENRPKNVALLYCQKN